ncbi:MAG: DUF1543 domain-containing protein [Alphaproteobacteria bacterium]|nr:DUF1543 domain-containing protein [Alphaproteobacteria bacterium]
MADKLFAVYLGGRAHRGNTELHDVVFVTGTAIEDTYEQLMDKWFGSPEGLHLDSWLELDYVDGYRVTPEGFNATGNKLFFVNLGAYEEGAFTEIHASTFIIATEALEAKKRAKAELLPGWASPVHTDDLYDVDDCIEIAGVGLVHTGEASHTKPVNGYHIIPKAIVEDYISRHPDHAAPLARATHG